MHVRSGLLALLLAVSAPLLAGPPPVLARVSPGDLSPSLAVHARIAGEGGREAVLVVATREALAASGARYSVLDDDARGVPYALVSTRPGGSAPRDLPAGRLLAVEGRHAVVRFTRGDLERLSEAGLLVKRLPASSLAVRERREALLLAPAAYDPLVAALVSTVTQTAVTDVVGKLSGETAVTVGGSPYTILTRHTRSGTPIQKATEWAAGQLSASGLTTGYFPWVYGSTSNRNVVAEKVGETRPSEIVLVTAHVDDMPASGRAPGADDNASGSTAVLLAAKALSTRKFERTVRFVLFTGEEQGMYGSEAYAAAVYAAGEDVVAVLNLDMVAWDSDGDGAALLHTRTPGDPGYPADRAIADLLSNVVLWYGLDAQLSPRVEPDATPYSDHAAFWDRGYPSLLAIEDDVLDLNAWYHTSGDTLARLNRPYFIAFVKAAVGTAAHLAVPLASPGFFTAVPCRLVDTRAALGPLGGPALPPLGTRTFTVTAAPCGVPASAKAITLNVTAVDPAAAGHLTLYAGGSAPPQTSTLNFPASRTRANNAVLALASDGSGNLAVASGAPGPVHVLLDVTGWFE